MNERFKMRLARHIVQNVEYKALKKRVQLLEEKVARLELSL
jgi:hypothetical protein